MQRSRVQRRKARLLFLRGEQYGRVLDTQDGTVNPVKAREAQRALVKERLGVGVKGTYSSNCNSHKDDGTAKEGDGWKEGISGEDAGPEEEEEGKRKGNKSWRKMDRIQAGGQNPIG